MTLVWLVLWVVSGAPVFLHGHHEAWLIAGVVCIGYDALWFLRRHA